VCVCWKLERKEDSFNLNKVALEFLILITKKKTPIPTTSINEFNDDERSKMVQKMRGSASQCERNGEVLSDDDGAVSGQ
jgi:hypothetical protein